MDWSCKVSVLHLAALARVISSFLVLVFSAWLESILLLVHSALLAHLTVSLELVLALALSAVPVLKPIWPTLLVLLAFLVLTLLVMVHVKLAHPVKLLPALEPLSVPLAHVDLLLT